MHVNFYSWAELGNDRWTVQLRSFSGNLVNLEFSVHFPKRYNEYPRLCCMGVAPPPFYMGVRSRGGIEGWWLGQWPLTSTKFSKCAAFKQPPDISSALNAMQKYQVHTSSSLWRKKRTAEVYSLTLLTCKPRRPNEGNVYRQTTHQRSVPEFPF